MRRRISSLHMAKLWQHGVKIIESEVNTRKLANGNQTTMGLINGYWKWIRAQDWI
jgi:hypothetical protein